MTSDLVIEQLILDRHIELARVVAGRHGRRRRARRHLARLGGRFTTSARGVSR